jgi:hypothetical protein
MFFNVLSAFLSFGIKIFKPVFMVTVPFPVSATPYGASRIQFVILLFNTCEPSSNTFLIFSKSFSILPSSAVMLLSSGLTHTV